MHRTEAGHTSNQDPNKITYLRLHPQPQPRQARHWLLAGRSDSTERRVRRLERYATPLLADNERVLEQRTGARPLLVVVLERALQEVDSVRRDVVRDVWAAGGRADLGGVSVMAIAYLVASYATYLEDSLHGVQRAKRRDAREHFHHETSDTPDVGLKRVRRLLDDLGGHPVDRALEGYAVRAVASGVATVVHWLSVIQC